MLRPINSPVARATAAAARSIVSKSYAAFPYSATRCLSTPSQIAATPFKSKLLQTKHESWGSRGPRQSYFWDHTVVALPVQQSRTLKTIEQIKSRNRSGPFSWKAGLLFAVTGAFLIWFFEHEKERMKRKRMAEANKGYGKARVGGPFTLRDTKGNLFTEEDLKGKFNLVYFGFTHCPDICPEELDKMATMYEIVKKEMPDHLQPLFITCDPARDDPRTLETYLNEFHPDFVGLTGTYEQVKAACKAYRVYFSTPENVKPGEDYLVDHSIYFYIMDPEGEFVEVLGRQHSPQQGAKDLLTHMRAWKGKWKI